MIPRGSYSGISLRVLWAICSMSISNIYSGMKKLINLIDRYVGWYNFWFNIMSSIINQILIFDICEVTRAELKSNGLNV